MSPKTFTATLIGVVLVGSAALLAVPQRAYAASGVVGAVSCIGSLLTGGTTGLATGAVSAALSVPVFDASNLAKNTITAAVTTSDCIYSTIIQPLARFLARMVLQQITASTINWINGGNGTGVSLYVRNIPAYMQGIGDYQAAVFLGNITQLNSPFGASIASALKTNYLQQTSAAGFFAANKCTLQLASPNIGQFVAGNWAQGGVRAWFALTTQEQNNPFMLYYNSQNQLARLAGTAQATAAQNLSYGRGFLSWCGGSSTAKEGTLPIGFTGTPPMCMNPDGSTAPALTPASVVGEYTRKAVVDSGIDQLVNVQDIDSALGAIIAALGNRLLGAGGGLFGASQAVGGITADLQAYSSGGAGSSGTGSNLSTRTAQYQTAITAASNAAQQAETDLAGLPSQCSSAAGAAATYISQVQAAYAFITQGQAILANANAVLAQGNAASTGVAAIADVPPTTQDIASMQDLIGQMNGVSATAQQLAQSCSVQAP